ncbi:MAG: hypothetical protein LUC16_00085 [Coprobacillus sp.]|nr:hypothetical protein [Coprobacillus sp.]
MKRDDEEDERILNTSLSHLVKRFADTNVIENIEKEYESSNSFHGYIRVDLIDDSPILKNVRINKKVYDRVHTTLYAGNVYDPLVVARNAERYEVVYPRAIYYAAKDCNYENVDCYVIEVEEEEKLLLQAAYLKNNRESSIIELSYVLNRLYRKYHISQGEIAEAMNFSRSQVTNILRLKKLPQSVINDIIDEKISVGHVRALMTLSDEEILHYVDEIKMNHLSVRETERLIYSLKHNLDLDELENKLSAQYSCKASVTSKKVTLSWEDEYSFNQGTKKLLRPGGKQKS